MSYTKEQEEILMAEICSQLTKDTPPALDEYDGETRNSMLRSFLTGEDFETLKAIEYMAYRNVGFRLAAKEFRLTRMQLWHRIAALGEWVPHEYEQMRSRVNVRKRKFRVDRAVHVRLKGV